MERCVCRAGIQKRKRHDVGNYHPISLTSVVCKIMEKLIREVIISHMFKNGLLSDKQHGFINGHSCNTQLLEVLDMWTELVDLGEVVDVIYLDFAKAFDTVPHERLLLKMQEYGVEGKVLE